MPEQEQEEEEMGESTGFDQDSDDESKEEEETEEDRAFIDDDDLEEEEDDLSFYRQIDLQLPERRRPVALPAAPVQTTNRLLKKGTTADRLASSPRRTGGGGFQLKQIRSECALGHPVSPPGPSLGH